jgi:lysophospholipase L1-like esterase
VKRAALALLLAAAALVPWWASANLEPEPPLFRTWAFSHFLACAAWSGVMLALASLVLSRAPLRERVLRVALVAFTVLGVIAVAEAPTVWGHDWARSLGTLDTRLWFDPTLGANRPDPDLIHIHWPRESFRGRVVGNLVGLGIPSPGTHEVEVSYDGNGFRNDQDLEQADLVLIGDSFVEGPLVRLDETVAKQLETRLGLVTANLGQSGYTLQQEAIVLERFGLPLRPRLVLWFLFGGNDLRDVKHYEWLHEHFQELQHPKAVPLRERLFLRNVLLALSRASTRHLPGRRALAQSAIFRRADGEEDVVYFDEAEAPWSEHDWQVMTETLRDAAHRTRKTGARFVLVYIPRKFRVYREHVTADPASDVARWRQNDLPEELAAWCAREKIELVDTTPILEAEAARGVHTYFVDDVHWNPRGHEVVADLLARKLGE